jgi:hypothetical protein
VPGVLQPDDLKARIPGAWVKERYTVRGSIGGPAR